MRSYLKGREMVPQKVQLEETDLEFIETACKVLNFKSRSEYMRAAIQEKIRADKRRLREIRRQEAMEAYGDDFDVAFEAIEAEGFEAR